MPHFFGEAKKRVGCRAEHPATPHGSEASMFYPPADAASAPCAVARSRNLQPSPTAEAASRRYAGWRVKRYVCPAGRPSRVSARQPTYFSCFAKRSRQEKATPEMPPRCAGCPRRWHRNREASETRFAQTADASLSDFGTSDVASSTGIHCNSHCQGNGNGHFKSNGHCNGNGNRNRNRNCRCAGNGSGRCAKLLSHLKIACR